MVIPLQNNKTISRNINQNLRRKKKKHTHTLHQIIKKFSNEIGDIRNASRESMSKRDSKKNYSPHTPPFSYRIYFEDEEAKKKTEMRKKSYTMQIYFGMFFPSFGADDEDEVVEQIHTNDYDLRSKVSPTTSKSLSMTSLTNKNKTTSKSYTTSNVMNIEYNLVYGMQKT